MIRILKIIAICLLGLITVIFASITVQRLRLDYNEMGNHFDEASSTNYSDGGIISYAFLTVIFLIPTIILVRSFWKSQRKRDFLDLHYLRLPKTPKNTILPV